MASGSKTAPAPARTPRRPARDADDRGRREPVQERSRRTVRRILEATEAIIGEEGVDAVTTRAIAARAGVAAPSLYRFFKDRDAVLDALLEAMLEELEAAARETELAFSSASVEEFVRLEFDVHVAYYERHPSLARLWFDGRVSPAVVDLVRGRNRAPRAARPAGAHRCAARGPRNPGGRLRAARGVRRSHARGRLARGPPRPQGCDRSRRSRGLAAFVERWTA